MMEGAARQGSPPEPFCLLLGNSIISPHSCVLLLSAVRLCPDGTTFVPQVGGGVGDGNENDRGH